MIFQITSSTNLNKGDNGDEKNEYKIKILNITGKNLSASNGKSFPL